MTRFLHDILRQPPQLEYTLAYLTGEGAASLASASDMLQSARHVFLTGIGSSWHAALSAATIFYQAAQPVYLIDAAELLHFADIPRDSVLVMLSRTGRSIEILRLIEKAHARGARVIGVTNARDSALARASDAAILIDIEFDHAISVNTYSTLALAPGLLAARAVHQYSSDLIEALLRGIRKTSGQIPLWRDSIEVSSWLAPQKPYYFLARGASLGSANEARLLWEEGVKQPATAMGTGSFRHGPQEIVAPGLRFAIWLDAQKMREEDLAVARDLTRMGAKVALIGQHLPSDAGAGLAFEIPDFPIGWQYAADFLPAQLLAERLSRLSGVDCDSFRFCSYVVEHEGGLLR
jgi:glucosamine--fructose-6-phosphate aminotransferase (isomerizing)